MSLSIIILNYKTKNLVKYCIKGIKLVGLKLDYEIIVIDNASQDGTPEMIRKEFPEVKLIEVEKNRGYTGGNNLGLKQAKGKYILILNPDIVVLEGAIEKMYEFMENHPKIGLLGPKLINPDKSLQETCYRFPKFITPLYRRTFLGKFRFAKKHLDHFLMKDYDRKKARKVDWVQGSCLMARNEAIKEVGLFDEKFFAYFEDVDWCRRFSEKNWEVWYLPEAELVHYHEQASAGGLLDIFKKSTRIHIVSWLKYFWKYRKHYD